MLLFVYTTTCKGFVIFTCRYFKLSWNTSALSQSKCRTAAKRQYDGHNLFCYKCEIELHPGTYPRHSPSNKSSKDASDYHVPKRSQMGKPSPPSCWSAIRLNIAKFFGNPATPAWGGSTSILNVGQRVELWNKRSKQPELFAIKILPTDFTLEFRRCHCWVNNLW